MCVCGSGKVDWLCDGVTTGSAAPPDPPHVDLQRDQEPHTSCPSTSPQSGSTSHIIFTSTTFLSSFVLLVREYLRQEMLKCLERELLARRIVVVVVDVEMVVV